MKMLEKETVEMLQLGPYGYFSTDIVTPICRVFSLSIICGGGITAVSWARWAASIGIRMCKACKELKAKDH